MIRIAKTLLTGAALATPSLAFAHSPIQGINNFYNGVLHPALIPAQLMLVLVLGLYLGQRDVAQNQSAVAAFLIASIVGLVVAGFTGGIELQLWFLGATVVVGGLVAADLALGKMWSALASALGGVLMGLDSGPDGLTGLPKLVMLFGCFIGMALLLMFPMALADYCRGREWMRIGVRVVAAWVVAAGVMVGAFLVVD